MANIFEPTPRFQKGVHKAIEVDDERLEALIRAIEAARELGEPDAIVALINDKAGVRIRAEDFFEADDGYPACGNLVHYIPRIVRADGTSFFGLDLLGEIYSGELISGRELVDRDKPESPSWVRADIDLPFRYCSADELLETTDFTAGIDQEAVGNASEAMDMGELGDDISGVGDFQVDALDDWAARLRDGLTDYRFALEDVAAREGTVLTWYDRS